MTDQFQIPQKNKNIFSSISQFDIKQKIGKGAFSEVYLAIQKNTQNLYAIKIIDTNNLSKNDFPNLSREILIHRSTQHDNITVLYDYFQERNKVYLVLEYCQNSNLFQQIYLKEKISLPKIQSYLTQLISALEYLHSMNIIHRDLKPENLLLDKDMEKLAICDFGWACHVQDYQWLRIRAGTKQYMAPEVLKCESQSEKTDIWAIGILLYEMLFAIEPFKGQDWSDMYDSIKQGVRFQDDTKVPDIAKDLILSILKFNQSDRPSLQQILQHQFFKQDFTLKNDIDIMQNNNQKKLQQIQQNEQLKRTYSKSFTASNQWVNTVFNKTLIPQKNFEQSQIQSQNSQKNSVVSQQDKRPFSKPQSNVNQQKAHFFQSANNSSRQIKLPILNHVQFGNVYSKFNLDESSKNQQNNNLSVFKNSYYQQTEPKQSYQKQSYCYKSIITQPQKNEFVQNNIYNKNSILQLKIQKTPQFKNDRLQKLFSNLNRGESPQTQQKNHSSNSQQKRVIYNNNFSNLNNFQSTKEQYQNRIMQTEPSKYVKSFQRGQKFYNEEKFLTNNKSQSRMQVYQPNNREFYIQRSLRVFSKSPTRIQIPQTSILKNVQKF